MSTEDRTSFFEKSNVLWGGEAIGAHIRRTRRQVYDLYEKGQLRGVVKIGGRLAAIPERLMANFEPEPNTEAKIADK